MSKPETHDLAIDADWETNKPAQLRKRGGDRRRISTHGTAALLEQMTLEEFDRVVNGDLDADDLYEKYGVVR